MHIYICIYIYIYIRILQARIVPKLKCTTTLRDNKASLHATNPAACNTVSKAADVRLKNDDASLEYEESPTRNTANRPAQHG